jgi:hypothetical protein
VRRKAVAAAKIEDPRKKYKIAACTRIKERHLRDGGEDVPAVCSIYLAELRLGIDAEKSL